MDEEENMEEEERVEAHRDDLSVAPRSIDLRGEIEVTVQKALVESDGDVINPSSFILSLTIGEESQEGVIHLSSSQVKKILKILKIKGVLDGR
jgi:hypothetical protein